MLRGDGQEAKVIVEDVSGDAEAGTDAGIGIDRVVDAYTREEVVHLRLGCAKGDESWGTGLDIEGLLTLADRDRSELVTEAEVEAELLGDAPSVVSVAVEGSLVAVIEEVAGGPFTEAGGGDILKIFGKVVVLIVAAHALCKTLRGDELATIKAKLEAVLAPDVAHVVSELIQVLNRRLRCVGIGTHLDIAHVANLQVGEGVEPLEGEVADWVILIEAIEADADLVDEVGREVVELAQSDDMEALRQIREKRGEAGRGVNAGVFVEDVAAAEAVLGRDGPVCAGGENIEVVEVRGRDEIVAKRHSHSARGTEV